MKLAQVLSAIGFLIMAFMIVRAILTGDFSGEGADLVRGPWGQLSLVDVYIGFLVFSGWIIFREQSFLRSLLWIISLLILGNLIACLYVFLALHNSQDDWHRFWLGRQALPAQTRV